MNTKISQKFKESYIYHLIRALRPRQWLKNLSIYAPPFFWGNLFDQGVFVDTTKAVFVFIMASSATYLINDVVDAEKDRAHPIKKYRPVAGGFISEKEAVVVAFALVSAAIIYARLNFGEFFILSVLGYFTIQIAYSLYFRNIIILDALTVATGFVVRVFAGTFAASVPISSWLVLAVIGLSLLLAFGKRRCERTILSAENIPLETRETLKHYPDKLLDSMISMSATFSILTYALFAFQSSGEYTSKLFVENLPGTLNSPKLLMLTIPMVIYGVARYLYVIYEKNEGESPERVLLSDEPLLNTIGIWMLTVLLIIYGFRGD